MADSQINLDPAKLRDTILSWLQGRLDEEELEWIASKSHDLTKGSEDWQFFTAFSGVPRHTGKAELNLTEDEQKEAEQIRPGWKPAGWSVDQLGRTLLILSIAEEAEDKFLDKLEKTFISSDIGEAVALYQALPVLPYPEKLQKRAAEGIRSNMTSVFNAVALNNPYPAEYLDERAWNQLVLKALFVESPLYKIEGIDQRRNKKLAEMLVDYAHERWAADRNVTPELWRPVAPFTEGKILDDLEKVLGQPEEIQQKAALLALSESPAERAQRILENHKALVEEIDHQKIGWNTIGRQFNE